LSPYNEERLASMAIVCHCEVVRERTIVKAIHRGAATLSEVQVACGAATGCGGCESAIDDLLAVHVRGSWRVSDSRHAAAASA
jgi:NAD(P)H-nitrite reductase large subunit